MIVMVGNIMDSMTFNAMAVEINNACNLLTNPPQEQPIE